MKVSVIVCTRNRAHAIINCLNSISAALTFASPIDAEIVVVDNGSTDHTQQLLKDWAAKCGFPVLLPIETIPGVSRARNCGLRHATGDLFIWTDDDCCLKEDHVIVAIKHAKAETILTLRGGSVELGDPTDLNLTTITRSEPGRWNINNNSARHENIANYIFCCNMSMRREVFNKIGFFDERLGTGSSIPGGEDTDYVCRVYLAGMDLAYSPDMVVHHFHGRKTSSQGYKLFYNYCLGGGAVYAKYFFKHLNLCRQFWWDLKNLAKEFVLCKSLFLPELGFSYKVMFKAYLIGMWRYLRM